MDKARPDNVPGLIEYADMVIVLDDVEQGSEEWFAARIGIPSASVFDKIIGSQGKLSTQQQKLIYQLAGERITGEKEESYTNGAMQRGTELEPEARECFELITDLYNHFSNHNKVHHNCIECFAIGIK